MAANHPDNFGVSIQRPKFPQYAVISKRLESFKNWPTYLSQEPDILTEAGFVYTGVADGVRCYHCGKGLKNWEKNDEPWVEHAKWYPDCPHVKLVKGQDFIKAVLSGESPRQSEPTTKAANEKSQTVENLMESDAAQSCLQMGFLQGEVQQAITTFISSHGHSDFRGKDLCEIILDLEETSEVTKAPAVERSNSKTSSNADGSCESGNEGSDSDEEEDDPEEIQKLLEENERLKTDRQCKICLDSDASVVFLPCGHMVSCPMCAPALVKCPICRVTVKGYIRTYLP